MYSEDSIIESVYSTVHGVTYAINWKVSDIFFQKTFINFQAKDTRRWIKIACVLTSCLLVAMASALGVYVAGKL